MVALGAIAGLWLFGRELARSGLPAETLNGLRGREAQAEAGHLEEEDEGGHHDTCLGETS